MFNVILCILLQNLYPSYTLSWFIRDTSVPSQRSYRSSYYFIRRFILVGDVPLTTNSASVSVLKIRKISDCLPRETEDSGPPSCLHKDAYRAQRWEEIERGTSISLLI